mgnify:CR=1 FL=1
MFNKSINKITHLWRISFMANSVRFINSIHHIGLDQWRALSATDNPFLRFEFLAALEDCQCVDSPNQQFPNQQYGNRQAPLNSGWIPSYALLENQELKEAQKKLQKETESGEKTKEELAKEQEELSKKMEEIKKENKCS